MIVVAAAVIRDPQGRILLTKRLSDAHLGGQWEFPGGKLEEGESPEEAVVRECKEECDIDIRVCDILDVTFHSFSDKDVLLLFYDCEWKSGEVVHIGVADHVWVTGEDLPNYPLPPADAPVVAKILKRLRHRLN